MVAYQHSLPKGEKLNYTWSVYPKKTSSLISVFRDNRPIAILKDERLLILDKMHQFFMQWRNEVTDNREFNAGERQRCLPSLERVRAMGDRTSLLLKFKEICRIHLQDHSVVECINIMETQRTQHK